MSGETRGQNEFKEMWFTDDVDYDIDGASAFIGDEDTTGGIIKALEDARDGDTAILLDTTSNGDAPLMAGAFIKNEGAGDPANTGNERAKITLEAKVDGLQKTTDMTVYKAILAMKGQRKNVYHIDRRLGVVEKAKNMPVNIAGDGTNNQANVTTISSEQIGTESDIWMRRSIPLLLIPVLTSPQGVTSQGFDNPRDITFLWGAVTGVSDYQIQVRNSGGIVADELVEGAVTTVISLAGALEPLYITYYWKVRSVKGSIVGPWSDEKSFNVKYRKLIH